VIGLNDDVRLEIQTGAVDMIPLEYAKRFIIVHVFPEFSAYTKRKTIEMIKNRTNQNLI